MMRTSSLSALLWPSTFALWLLVGGSAVAQENEAERLFRLGTEALEEGRLPEARTHLEQSLELNPHPGAAFNLMMTLADLDELLEASTLCHRLLEGDYGSLEGRRVQVERLCEGIWEDIPVLEIVATGAPTIRLRIDGESHGELSPDEPMTRQLDPGRHVIRVDAAEHRGEERAVDLRRRERGQVELRVLSDQDTKRRRLWMTALIVGGAVLIGAAIAIGVAAGRRDEGQPTDGEIRNVLSDGALVRW